MDALARKVSRHRNPFQTLTLNYGPSKVRAQPRVRLVGCSRSRWLVARQGKMYTEEEDRFLVCMMAQLGCVCARAHMHGSPPTCVRLTLALPPGMARGMR